MIKLSEISGDTQLCIELYGDAELLLMDKEDFIQEYLEDDLERSRVASVAIAAENPAKFDLEDVHNMLWNASDSMGQYDDWEEDMFEAIKESSEVKSFLSYMNRLARKHMSFEMGEDVEVDL